VRGFGSSRGELRFQLPGRGVGAYDIGIPVRSGGCEDPDLRGVL
jgi:hypothetical protein